MGAVRQRLDEGDAEKYSRCESDMIFSAICGEFGVIFGAGIIGIFIMLLYRGVRIALDCNRRYYSILAAGVTTLISFQAFVILGGVMKLIPLTGVTLPVCQLRRQLGSGQPDDDWAFAVGMRILRAARSAGAGGAADDGGNTDGRRQI